MCYHIIFNNGYGYVSSSYILIINTDDENNDSSKYEKFLICIDPGHQSKGDLDKEPIGPGSSETKYKVSYGTQGVVTNLPEYELTLQTAKILEAYLEEMGFMTNSEEDKKLSDKAYQEAMMKAVANSIKTYFSQI